MLATDPVPEAVWAKPSLMHQIKTYIVNHSHESPQLHAGPVTSTLVNTS